MWNEKSWSVVLMVMLVLSVALAGCEKDTEIKETVTAEEIAEGEGIADPAAEPEDRAEIADELLFEGDEDLFDGFDADRDEVLSVEEFAAGVERVKIFGQFDVNEDAVVSEDEFYNAMFKYWDVDQNGFVEPIEYLGAAMTWFPEDTKELENFADVDADNDGALSRPEFVANMDDIALFDQWDLEDDAEISADELVKVLRDVWDIDRDQKIQRREFGGPTEEQADMKAIKRVEVAIARPVDFVGTMVTGEVVVDEVISDRGFWVGDGENRIFAVVREDVPRKEMIDIEKGQKLKFSGLLLSKGAHDDLKGTLEEVTRETILNEPAFLSIYHGQIDILGK